MPTIRQINDFNIGMNPNIYGEGISLIEHFDTITGQARPYRALVASTLTGGAATIKNLTTFCLGSSVLYALCQEVGTNYGTLAKWSTTNYRWEGFQSFNAIGTADEILFFRDDYLFGLWKGTHLWRIPKNGGTDLTGAGGIYQPVTYSTACKPIKHSKDGLHYLGMDNKIYSFDGTTLTLVLTLPSSFEVICISENGDYLSIAGYDSQINKGTEYLWNRDSSLANVTQKYDLFQETPYFNVTLGGTHFIITTSNESSNSEVSETVRLNIRYISGDKPKLHKQFVFQYCRFQKRAFFIEDRLYFNAEIRFLNDSSYHFVTFQLNEIGNLSIAQNVSIADQSSIDYALPGIIRDGDGFWLAGRLLGSWNSSSSYPTLSAQSSFIETVKYRAKDLTKNLDFIRATITWETMPTDGQVLLATRGDSETTWTTIATFTTNNSLKGTINKGGCTTQPSIAKERQFRIESTGGVIITGFQADFEEVSNQA